METTIQLKKVTVNLNEYTKLFSIMLSAEQLVKSEDESTEFWLNQLTNDVKEYKNIRP